MPRRSLSCVVLLAAGLAAFPGAAQIGPAPGPTVEAIRKRGDLACGVSPSTPGFAQQARGTAEKPGAWSGFDVDYCRAIAAAVLGDGERIRLVPVPEQARAAVLQSGEIDVLMRETALNFARSTQAGLDEVAVTFHSGQGFLVRRALGVASALALRGVRLCVTAAPAPEAALAGFQQAVGLALPVVLVDGPAQSAEALAAGRCDGASDEVQVLAAMRARLPDPGAWDILPERVTREPLGLHVRAGDPRWTRIVFWVDNALKSAEELAVTREGAEAMRAESQVPAIRRLLGAEGDLGRQLGLEPDWALRAIRAAGNYGEIYAAHFGPKALDIPRGPNRLGSQGGLHSPLPWR